MVCEPCNSKLLGGFDPDKKEVQLYSVRLFYLLNYTYWYFINRGYYMATRRYKISLWVLKNIFST